MYFSFTNTEPHQVPDILQRWQNISAFIFFAFCLSLPSGYSWGAISTLILALISFPIWRRQKISPENWILAILFLILGILWGHTFDEFWSWRNSDIGFKYTLAALCTLCVSSIPANVKFIRWGCIVGCVSACGIAILQFLSNGRADGYTNAIQFGDISIILAIICWNFIPNYHLSFMERSILLLAGFLGLIASFLSLSRGGWLLLLLLPFIFCLFAERLQRKIVINLTIFMMGSLAVIGALQIQLLGQRVQQVQYEVQAYLDNPTENANTSVGQRMEQWRLAWKMGQAKPLTGWGNQGLMQGKQEYVQRGEAHPSVLNYGHAHNEILDMWARRGILGIIILLMAYIVPISIFYPTSKRLRKVSIANRVECMALRISGMTVALGCIVFGLTQVFFAHNSGHMFYTFSLIFLFSAIRTLENKKFNNEYQTYF